jgi:defect-in-organelle-trafficking protein DotD
MIRKSILLILLAALAVGCQKAPPQTFKKPPMNAPSDDASVRLVEAASSVSSSLNDLAEIEAASTPPGTTGKPLPESESYALQSKASIDWSGPIEPLLERIARISGFRLSVLGKEPAIPVLVSLSAKNITLTEMLRDAALQAGKKADVLVYSNRGIIELRYAKM